MQTTKKWLLYGYTYKISKNYNLLKFFEKDKKIEIIGIIPIPNYYEYMFDIKCYNQNEISNLDYDLAILFNYDDNNYNFVDDIYKSAINCGIPENKIIPIHIFNIPNINLSICYFCLDKIDKAIYYNEMAAKYKTDSEIVLKNREIFKKIKGTN